VRRAKPGDNDAVGHRLEDPGEAVRQALDRLVRERVARKPGGHLVEAQLRQSELCLPLPPADRGAEARHFSTRLVAAIDERLDDLVQQAAAFRPGHAWCHRCESLTCEHSRPSSSRHVFVGYTPTGLPRWEDFAQLCLELKHPQVDQLYDDPPALVTLVQGSAALQGQMLAAFENESYELLGQLVAGFFSVRTRAEEGRGVLALTVQVAASRTRGNKLRLGLNLLGRTPAGDDLERLWDRHEELPWRKAVRWAQAALHTVTSNEDRRSGTPAPPAIERRVDRILQGLARRLEREHRARSRRTRHAEQRHASGRRPTRKALDDARAASGETLYVDERSGTMVVLGERGRTHFFTPEGRLVSSVRYSRDAIERKLKSELWRPAPRELMEEFQSKLPGAR
jgi:hypothetical protein